MFVIIWKTLASYRSWAVEALVRRFTSSFTSLNGETADGTASHFQDATICWLVLRLLLCTRLKHWFENDPQAASRQTARRSKEQQAIFEVLRFVCWLVLLLLLWTALCNATLWTNQMGYITLVAQLPWDLWRHKPTLSSGYALGLGRFTAINTCQLHGL